jgi:hypothetical protein
VKIEVIKLRKQFGAQFVELRDVVRKELLHFASDEVSRQLDRRMARDAEPGDTFGRSVMEDELERSRSKNRIVGEGLERAAREIKTLPVFDNWQHRSAGMRCSTCMFYVPKPGLGPSPLNGEQLVERGRCRRNAPSMNGWPVLLPSDWCGEHKLA